MRLLLFLLAAPLWAQLSVSTLNCETRHVGLNPYFNCSTTMTSSAAGQTITVTGSGAVTVGGCTNTVGTAICGGFSSDVSTNCGAQGSVCVMLGFIYATASAGTYQAMVPITRAGGTCSVSCTLTINLTIVEYTAPTINFPGGRCAGCSTSGAPYLDQESSPISNMLPGGTPPALPTTVGATQLDTTFGSTVHRLSAQDLPRVECTDAVTSSISATGVLACVTDPSGNFYLVDGPTGPSPGTIRFTNPTITTNLTWSAVSDNVYYTMPQNGCVCLHKVTLNLSTYTVTSDTAFYTYSGPGTATFLTNGGDGGVSSGDTWWAFFTSGGTATQVCLINLQTVTTYCSDWTLSLYLFPRWATVAKTADQNGKEWMMVGSFNFGNGIGQNELFSLASGGMSLTDEGPQPTHPDSAAQNTAFFVAPSTAAQCTAHANRCQFAVHADWGFGGNGHSLYTYTSGPGNPSYYEQVFLDPTLSGVNLMNTAIEAGGGMYETMPQSHQQSDIHVGCAANAPVCILGLDTSPTTNTVYLVTNVSVGATTTITTSPSYGGANGDVVLIGGMEGVTGLPFSGALCTVASLSGATFNCSGLTTSGTYTASTGSLTKNTALTLTPHALEMWLVDLTNVGTKHISITRLASSRSLSFGGDRWSASGYYGQSHPTITADGKYIIFESNAGVPDNYAVYWMSTGYVPPSATLSNIYANGLFIQ